MKHIIITSKNIVNSMTDDTKHSFTLYCLVNRVDPEETLEKISRIITNTINIAIDLCNDYFETPAGKEYLETRIKIENLGSKMKKGELCLGILE